MDINEKIYEDEKRWVCFESETEDETIGVYRRCPKCGRFITEGKVSCNLDGNAKLEGWKCSKHGEVKPFWIRW